MDKQDQDARRDGPGERLQKVLAAAGFGSRRHCEEYITTGRVTVDGQVVDNLGVRVDPERQKITVDGEKVKIQTKKYYLVNKPTGYLSTNSDPSGRPRVIDLLPPMETRLFSVGRLDENTEGLLLVTNDGELAHRLAHPRFQVERVYRVLVAGHPAPERLQELQTGVYFAEGRFRLRQAKKLKTKGQSTLLEVVITEGQNREVRRLFARIGHKVMSLQRVQFGPLRLGEMAPGEFRPLRPMELDRLREIITKGPVSRTRPPRAPGTGRGIAMKSRRAAGPPNAAPPEEQRPEGRPPRKAAWGKKVVGRPPAGEGRRPARPPAGEGARPARPHSGEGARPARPPAGDRPRPGRPAAGERPRPGRPAMKKAVRKRPPRPR